MSRLAASLATRVLLLFLVVTLVPLGLALFETRSDVQVAEQQAMAGAAASSAASADEIGHVLQDVREAAQTVSLLPAFWSGTDTDRDRVLASLASPVPTFNALAFMTPDFQTRGQSNYDPAIGRPSLESRAYAREALASGRTVFTDEALLALNRSGQAVLPVAVPIREPADEGQSGFLVAGLNVNRLPRIWDSQHLPPGSTIRLLHGQSGRILTATGDAGVEINALIEQATLDLIGAGRTAFRVRAADGTERLRAWSSISGSPWIILVDIPASAVFDPIAAEARRRITASVIGAGIGIVLLCLIWRQLSVRLSRLRLAGTRWTAGDLTFRSGLAGADELSHLGQMFDQMAEALALAGGENLHLTQRLALRARRFATLARLNQLVSASLDLDAVLREIARAAAELMEASAASFWLADPARRVLHVRVFSNDTLETTFPVRTVAYGDGATGWVAANRRPLNVPDVTRDDRVVGARWLVDHALHSYLGVPVVYQDELLAVLVLNGRHPFPDGPEEHDLLDNFVAQVSIAIRNASLYQDLVRAHEATEQSRRRLDAIIRSAAEAIVTVDDAGTIQSFNPAAERMFAYAASEAIGRSGRILLPEASDFESRADDGHGPADAPPAEPRAAFEALARRSDGSDFPVELSISETWIDGRRVLTWIVRDITERKQVEAEQARRLATERAARELAERFGAVLRAATESSIMGTDSDGTITIFNVGAERMLGYPAGEVIGRATPLIFHDPTEIALRAAELGIEPGFEVFAHLARQGQAETREWTYLRRDGSRLTASLTITAMRGDAGELIGFIVIATDITDRVRAERERARLLAEVERERSALAAIMGSMSEGLMVFDRDFRIRYCNRIGGALLGVDAGAFIGLTAEEGFGLIQQLFADPEAVWQAWQTALGHLTDYPHFEAVFAEPLRREVLFQLFPYGESAHEPPSVGMLIRDVTREREVDRMKSEFVSLVSHELRTPLTSIKGYVDLMLDGDVGDLTEEQTEFLEIVRSNADRLVGLINDLLDISRMEAGKIELQRQPIQVETLIRPVAESFRPAIEGKNQTLTLDLQPDLPPVLADADRLTQILTNLLSNAHKYTPAGGSITIETRVDPIDPDAVEVAFRDTGIGLNREEQTRLFEKFFRARNRTTQEVGGTGLGLAITRSLVEMHGGTIEVDSEPGAGSTFRFSFPVARAEEAAAGQAPLLESPAESRPGRRGRILVVDDEPDIARLLERYLERAGYAVQIASNAHDALEMVRTEPPPDLITLDILLPGIDGFTLLEWLQGSPATSGIPVILISMLPDDGRGKVLGAIDHLSKPVAEDRLIDQIHRVLAHRPARPILVADDEPDIRRLIAGQLRRAGYTVIEAADGDEAIAAIRSHLPGLALIDVRMPGLDGPAVLRELRADPSLCDIPVIMMTSSPGGVSEAQSLVESTHLTSLLTKPTSPAELARAIAAALSTADR